MKILCIGNSFSQDATRYLRLIAKSEGADFEVTNLYIGGCSLETHFDNIMANAVGYNVQKDGQYGEKYTTIESALKSDVWDIVTVQQASHYSFDYSTYQPYLNSVVETVKNLAPTAKIFIHQTWAYQDGTQKLNSFNFSSSEEMFGLIEKAYQKAFNDIKADGLIPSGKLILSLYQNGVENTHRDGFHLSLGIGRFAVGLLWYKVLTGNSIDGVSFNEFDEPVPQSEIILAKKLVNELA